MTAAEGTPAPKTIYERFPYLKLIVDRAEGRAAIPSNYPDYMQVVPKFPNHVAIIMDGNRRWADRALGPDTEAIKGHQRGMENMIEILRDLRQLPIDYVTPYAFSPDNWKRDQQEVDALMGLMTAAIPEVAREIHANNGRLIHLGRKDRIPAELRRVLGEAEAATEKNTGQTVCLAIDYGSEDQEVRVLQKALAMTVAEELPPGIADDEAEIEGLRKGLLDTKLNDRTDIPPIDLIFRTGGERRVSGLPNADYAEICIIEVPLPDATIADFVMGLVNYSTRNRRFGGDASK